MNIFILNAPKRAGKDTLALHLQLIKPLSNFIKTVSFKSKLIEIALNVSGVPKSEWDARYEVDKESPWNKLGGLSQRQFLIKISEEWVKPVFGRDYFGKALLSQIKEDVDVSKPYLFVSTDGGFNEEVAPFIEEGWNVYICQWSSKFTAYDSSDSRSYLSIPEGNKVKYIHLQENDYTEDWLTKSTDILKPIFVDAINKYIKTKGGVV